MILSNYSTLYWLTRLDAIQGLAGFALGIGLVALLCFVIFVEFGAAFYDDDEQKEAKKNFKWIKKTSIVLLLFGAIVLTFLPSKNEAILIFAGGKALDYIESDTSLNKIPYQTTQIVSEYLDKTLKEMKEKKSE